MKRKISNYFLFILIPIVFFGSCKDDNDDSKAEYDQSKATTVTKLSPESGGAGTRLILNGENFGNDVSRIKATIGGKNAKVVSAHGTSIYILVPPKAFKGDIVLTMLDADGNELKSVKSDINFDYQRKMMVTTLLGHVTPDGRVDEKDGPFDDCGAIKKVSWLSFDPKNPNHLYMIGDHGGAFRLIDFEKKYIKTILGNGERGLDRMRSIAWTADTNRDMVIATDRGESDQANTLLTRSSNFRETEVLFTAASCNGSDIHPVNGELYYSYWVMGTISRYDFKTKQKEVIFTIQDRGSSFYFQIHPTGDYAYIASQDKHSIFRTDYDYANKTFKTPYLVCGKYGAGGWADGLGTRARLQDPTQGVFVKNEEYAGDKDEYDFYFCDAYSHSIRTLTPNGKVTTYAGRGSTAINNNKWGYVDGDLRLEARFNQPRGIAYDEVNKIFYIGDDDNHRIRMISQEVEDTEEVENPENTQKTE